MEFQISPDIAARYAHLRLGLVTGRNLQPRVERNSSALDALRCEACEHLKHRYPNTEILAQHPFIAAWREVSQSFGVKASRHRPTAEALIRRVINGEEIPRITPLVDLYLIVEVKHLLPVGGYDLDRVKDPITLCFAAGGEEFWPIGGSEAELVNSGEVVYKDMERVLTRRWNYRDCDATKITDDSRNIVLMLEAPSDKIPTEDLQLATDDLRALLTDFFEGELKTQLIDCTVSLSFTI